MRNTETTASRPHITPRVAVWQRLMADNGLDTHAAVAATLDVHEKTVGRVLGGDTEPSAQFIAAALIAFPYSSFDRLFTIELSR